MKTFKQSLVELLGLIPIDYTDKKAKGWMTRFEKELHILISKRDKEIIGEDDKHTVHSEKDEWYTCIFCMESIPQDKLRQSQRERARKSLE